MKFNFNGMTKGEIAFRLDEAVRSLNADTPEFYDIWLANYDDGDDTVEKAKETWDDVSDDDALWDDLVSAFRYMVGMYGCEEDRSITDGCHIGLWYDNFSRGDDECEEVGGGFFIAKREGQNENASSRVARVRETLALAGYPLSETESGKYGYYFEIDWRKVRSMRAAEWIKSSIEWLSSQECGCCTIRLTAATQLAVGWENGFDPEDPSVIHSKSEPTWGICVGIKALDGDDLKTDFEWLTTPYAADGDNEGEVFSNLETSLSPKDDYEKIFEYLIGEYQGLLKDYKVHRDGKCFHKTL